MDLDDLLDSVSLDDLSPPPAASKPVTTPTVHPGVPLFREVLLSTLSKMDKLPKDCLKEGDKVVQGLGTKYGEDTMLGGIRVRSETDVQKGTEMKALIASE
ncbi:hypothetical protein TrVE_jg3313 [Triparma verrucosa]|uniref:Uncharacterized protein n=2 Tax=Triparma TaxID=722752 RepID=A0A9W7ABW9_9STRA|nr:hypothetical protein TrST_g9668 [Triparma strigata]GMI11044.1 hypothetical protein TrVE_jg3313 [Triparma verrucosa]|mmetsp:Transcript_10475/g.18981  ORF Transcript_10475/g.18981 Transcript_10475/m.18981 type:complete len:101 (-) Transcript_10475:50-352(-)|eukprot:CAMPEP_0182517894 /NCGR_PEP_ID=MMETSP1321-20130603/43134_1 /TAXON_ID=91990 /ORGANISM="Bolidomonas sp., Strain RCC1657" /LENGTH=100 /DNA_ID=CAMNT_0024725677 /DNA_START=109 /DNA_END=411 /DNA_ORIENTATION=+